PLDQNRLDGNPQTPDGQGNSVFTPEVAVSDYSPVIGVHPDLGNQAGISPSGRPLLNLVDQATISFDPPTTASAPASPNKSGNRGLLRKNATWKVKDALDGLSHTIMYAESAGRPNI